MCTNLTCPPSLLPLRSMSKSVLLCISTLLDGGNRARAQFSKMGTAAIFMDWTHVLTPPRVRAQITARCKKHPSSGIGSAFSPLACARRFNLSDSLGRPLFANIQVRPTATRLASARSSDALPLPPKDFARLRSILLVQTCAFCFSADNSLSCSQLRA